MSRTLALLTLLLLGSVGPANEPPPPDPVRLREMLHDRQQPRLQSQAALMLVLDQNTDAEEIVRRGLKQTDSPEVFAALTSALRLSRDVRFRPELFAAFTTGQPAFRQSAAAALAELMDAHILQRLEVLLEDRKIELPVRQLALATLGRYGRKRAAAVLVEQLSHDQEAIRRTASETLTTLTGRAYGLDVVRWREWWDECKDLSEERWLEERFDHQGSRLRRLESDLERTRAQVLRLQEQLYLRLPHADRLGHVLGLVDQEEPALRILAVQWSGELLPATNTVGQVALTDVLLRFSQDGAVEVQQAAVQTLGKVHDSRAMERLLVLLREGLPSVRQAAATSLAQQARGQNAEARARQRPIVPALRNALKDKAVEVVVAAAEGLGSLGVPEAGPVLTELLAYPSASVRQAASQALERIADLSLLNGLLQAVDDPVVTVRFRLVGAIRQAIGDGRALSDEQRRDAVAGLERLLSRDPDPGVRSRAASVLGTFAPPSVLAALWRRLAPTEDSRVQEKAWTAFVDILARAGNAELVLEWEQTLLRENQPQRGLNLLTEICTRWQKREEPAAALTPIQDVLVRHHLDQGKWSAALPHLRELLARPASESDLQKRLRWLLKVGQELLREENRKDAQRAAQTALSRRDRLGPLAEAFEDLEKRSRDE